LYIHAGILARRTFFIRMRQKQSLYGTYGFNQFNTAEHNPYVNWRITILLAKRNSKTTFCCGVAVYLRHPSIFSL
jgi:hypothetical protein